MFVMQVSTQLSCACPGTSAGLKIINLERSAPHAAYNFIIFMAFFLNVVGSWTLLNECMIAKNKKISASLN
jgi:hypothetical protein